MSTPEEKVQALQRLADASIEGALDSGGIESAIIALTLEVRALRITIQEEFREASWVLRGVVTLCEQLNNPIITITKPDDPA